MKERPIIFSAPMVRAILAGKKTQTRRVLKNVPPAPDADCHPRHQQKHPAPYLDAYRSARPSDHNPRGMSSRWLWWQVDDRACLPQFDVRYAPGDTLWVREAWGINDYRYGGAHSIPKSRPHDLDDAALVYFATEDDVEIRNEMPRRPSIHMPRWASRITLPVTAVRVERLHDISEDDARAEGCRREYHGPPDADDVSKYTVSARGAFSALWQRLHGPSGPASWDANPWVVALTFDRVTPE